MRNFLFVRHGQTDWNKNMCGLGYVDLPLNEDGVIEAKTAAKKTESIIPLDKKPIILSSPLIRTRQTAEIIAQHRAIEITFVEILHERFYGSDDKPGETDNEFHARVKDALEIIKKVSNNPDRFLIVVSHSIFFAKLAELLNVDAGPIATGGMFQFSIDFNL